MKRVLCIFFLFCFFSAQAEEPPSFTRPPSQVITPATGISLQDRLAELYFTADFLYWKTQEDGLEYVVSGRGSATRPVTERGKLFTPDFDGHPGFKVGVGLNLIHDGWDIYTQYTWMKSFETDHFVGDGYELIGIEFLLGGVSTSDIKWNFLINTIDLDWGRTFYISPFLIVKPVVGFKGFWSDQKVRVHGVGFSDAARTTSATDTIRFFHDGWGFGLRGGCKMQWSFTENWSAFGTIAAAAEWSRLRLKFKETGSTSAATLTLIDVKTHQNQMIPVLELAVGLLWEFWLKDNTSHVLFQMGWEEQTWWNFSNLLNLFNRGTPANNLSFQGLTARLRYDF